MVFVSHTLKIVTLSRRSTICITTKSLSTVSPKSQEMVISAMHLICSMSLDKIMCLNSSSKGNWGISSSNQLHSEVVPVLLSQKSSFAHQGESKRPSYLEMRGCANSSDACPALSVAKNPESNSEQRKGWWYLDMELTCFFVYSGSSRSYKSLPFPLRKLLLEKADGSSLYLHHCLRTTNYSDYAADKQCYFVRFLK